MPEEVSAQSCSLEGSAPVVEVRNDALPRKPLDGHKAHSRLHVIDHRYVPTGGRIQSPNLREELPVTR
jgi:hypothetical protein